MVQKTIIHTHTCTHKAKEANINNLILSKRYTDRSSLFSSCYFSINFILYQNQKLKKCFIWGNMKTIYQKLLHYQRTEESFIVFKIRLKLLTHQNYRSPNKNLPNKVEGSEWVLWFLPTSINIRNLGNQTWLWNIILHQLLKSWMKCLVLWNNENT